MGTVRSLVQHPDSADLTAALATIVTASFRGNVYRSAEPKYARKTTILSGRGSSKFGGRWNPRGLRTVYASATPETAMAESLAHLRRYGFDPAGAFPRKFVAVQLKLTRLVDLTDARIRRWLGISLTEIRMQNWRSVNRKHHETRSQAIGRLVFAVGLEGLIVPACDGGKNLVWFPKRLRRRSYARLK